MHIHTNNTYIQTTHTYKQHIHTNNTYIQTTHTYKHTTIRVCVFTYCIYIRMYTCMYALQGLIESIPNMMITDRISLGVHDALLSIRAADSAWAAG